MKKASLAISLGLLVSANVWASVHTKHLSKSYTGPVSSSEALRDLEAEAKAEILGACAGKSAYAKKFVVSIPFDTSDFMFYRDGIPGSVEKPVFGYFSYPTVHAELEFVCSEN